MKIFYVTNPRMNTELEACSLQINNYLSALKEDDVNNLLDWDLNAFDNKSKNNIKMQKTFYKNVLNSIQQSDICIFEATNPSFGIGYFIEKSLSFSKPTIILFYEEITSYILPHIQDERVIVKTYTEKNLKKVLKQALSIAKERRDKRFNFYLSTKLLEHIDLLSKQEGATKSKIMRDIILRDMRGRGIT